MTKRNAQVEARKWFDKFGQPRVTTADVEAFGIWRGDPENDAAYSALELSLAPGRRFAVRPMTESFKIVDSWTGETVSVAEKPQMNLSEEEARRLALALNRRRD